MKRLAGTIALLLFAGVATGDRLDQTNGYYNGLYWNRCPTGAKAGIVVGYMEAIKATDFLLHWKEKHAHSGTVGDMVRELDRIYADKEMEANPIWISMRLAVLRINGVPISKWDEELADVLRPVK